MANAALVCPSCGREHPPSERFCEQCRMPLVHGEQTPEPQDSARRERARKIRPEYTEGKLVKIARANSQPEAEFIEGMLLEEGIPCMLQRSAGFDVPEVLAGGARDVLVPESGAEAAREALAWEPPPSSSSAPPTPAA